MSNSDTSLAEKIYKQLYEDITHQRLVRGQKLTLPMLKERFHVSHTPIREALSRLIADGLVVYTVNKSMKVVEFSEEDIKELFQLMTELECVAIHFCSTSFATAPMINDIRRIVEAEKTAIQNNDFDTWNQAADSLHGVFYYYAENKYLDRVSTRMSALMDTMAYIYSNEDTWEEIYERHVAIYHAAEQKDFAKICDLIRDHLQFGMIYVLGELRKERN